MFHKYGVSGTIEKFDALCVLGMNIINEKVTLIFLYVFTHQLLHIFYKNTACKIISNFYLYFNVRYLYSFGFGM